jgi:hypothetical protein
MTLLVSAQQLLTVLRTLEPGAALTYQQLRDLERRGCVAPRVMPGGRGPRVYGVEDVVLLRLIARLQADPLLARWQVWSVVAHLREELTEALVAGHARVLVIQGARGVIVSRREAARLAGVECELSDVSRGVRDAMHAASGEVWSGAAWVSVRHALTAARPLAEAIG